MHLINRNTCTYIFCSPCVRFFFVCYITFSNLFGLTAFIITCYSFPICMVHNDAWFFISDNGNFWFFFFLFFPGVYLVFPSFQRTTFRLCWFSLLVFSIIDICFYICYFFLLHYCFLKCILESLTILFLCFYYIHFKL